MSSPAHPAPATAAASAVKQRALTGAAMLTLRGLAIRLIAFASNIVVARYIAPGEFGIFMLGGAVLTAASFFTDAGMAAALVRRSEEPTRADLCAVQGFQLVISLLVAAVAVGVGASFGSQGLIVGVMALSLPIATLRVPSIAV